MIWESIASGTMFAMGSGGFMAAFGLALGASNFEIGMLAALPFLTQVLQMPAILLIERLRLRKAVGVPAVAGTFAMWIPIALIPLFLDVPSKLAVALVILFLAIRGIFAPVWIVAWAAWLRDLVPIQTMGTYHARRLAVMTAVMAVVGLGGSFFIQWWEGMAQPDDAVLGYSIFLIGGALLLGPLGTWAVWRASEPLMPPAQLTGRSAISILIEPLRDRNFSPLVKFLFVWSLTTNLAIPFFVVFMLTKLELALPVVIGLIVLGQLANVSCLKMWGPLADKVGSKTVLSLSASLYLLVILSWTFTTQPDRYFLTMPLLVILHVLAGAAAAGVTLTVGTLAFKIAPPDRATAFMGTASAATNVGAGIGPILGGLLADVFVNRILRIDITWGSSDSLLQLPAVVLTGFDFLFAIAFFVALMSLNVLVRVREEGEIPRDAALTELMSGISPLERAVAAVPGIGPLSDFSYGYLKRVPGADVAIGVMAYQLASSTQAAVSAADTGRTLARDVSRQVGDALGTTLEEMEGVADQGLELARHATRGALQAGDEFTDHMGRLTRGAVQGTVRTLVAHSAEVDSILRGAGYGVVQGAVEAGEDPALAAVAAVEAARDMASEIGVSSDEAAASLATGLLDAAAAVGGQTLASVEEALPDNLVPTEGEGKDVNPQAGAGS